MGRGAVGEVEAGRVGSGGWEREADAAIAQLLGVVWPRLGLLASLANGPGPRPDRRGDDGDRDSNETDTNDGSWCEAVSKVEICAPPQLY